jgi:DNA-directed RNA polymerase specialized sigma24 family protein
MSADWQEIDTARDRFEAEWRSGRMPCIEDYLAQASERVRPALLSELLKLELSHRREEHEVPVLEEDERRFSEYAGLVRAVFANLISREPDPTSAARVAEEYKRLLGLLPDDSLRKVAEWKLEGYTNAEIAAKLKRAVVTVEWKLRCSREIWEQEI